MYKRYLFSTILLMVMTGMLFAQNNSVTLTFTGQNSDGTYVRLDKVDITNVSRGWTETIFYPDTILKMDDQTGIEDFTAVIFDIENVRPNPFDGTTQFDVAMPQPGDLLMQVTDMNGQIVAEYKGNLGSGIHTFEARLRVPGTYMLRASCEQGYGTEKLVNSGHGGYDAIAYITTAGAIAVTLLSSQKGVTDNPFQTGDVMMYKGFATRNGTIYESVPIVQPQSLDETFVLAFDIPEENPPVVTTDAFSEVTAVSAICSGTVTDAGSSDVTARGFCWSMNHNPTVGGIGCYNQSADISGVGSYTVEITDLQPATTYYVKAYAINSFGTSYGNEKEFTTNDGIINVVTDGGGSNITATTATWGGAVTDDGGMVMMERGMCYSSTNESPTVDNTDCQYVAAANVGTGSYSCELSNLEPNTLYYVCAYATNAQGHYYGETATFTTDGNPPTVTIGVISNVTALSASVNGTVTDAGSSEVTARGFCWSTNQNPTVGGTGCHSLAADVAGVGNYSIEITGLQPVTTYYVRSYATNSFGMTYGEQVEFTTDDGVIMVMTDENGSDITTTTATWGGEVTDDGGMEMTECGICWSSTNSIPTVDGTGCFHIASANAGAGSFTCTLNDLLPNTLYHVRAYAANAQDHYYGETKTFTTDGTPPMVTTNSVSDIMALSATCGGNVADAGSSEVTERGVCWSTNQNPTVGGANCYSLATEMAEVGSYIIDIIGLQPATTYYVKAYATNEFGTAYGEEVEFTTDDGIIMVMTDENGSDITTTTATWGGEVTDDGGMEMTERGICWSSTVVEPTVDGADCSYIVSANAGTGTFTCTLTDLLPNTSYHVRAYAANAQNHYYGETKTFTTDGNPPIVTTNGVSNITAVSATCGCNVADDGSSEVTECGACWSTNQNPTVDGANCYNLVAETAGVGSYVVNMTGLQSATIYYVKAYATNESGTSYGEEVEFTTDDGIIHITTAENGNDITTTMATWGGEIADDGGMEIAELGMCWSNTVAEPTVDGAGCSHVSSANAGVGSFTCLLTDLLPNTLYHVRAYAANAQDHYYGETKTFTTDGNPPTVTTNSVSNIMALSAICSGNVTNEGSSAVTERGVCWSIEQNPIIGGTNCQNQSSEATGLGNYIIDITGLQLATTYYVKAYATNEFGTSYGEEVEFTTDDGVIHITTDENGSDITTTVATWGGEVTDDGGMEVIERGICWSSTNSLPTVDGTDCSYIASANAGIGTFTCTLTDLLPNTSYHVRAYAANAQNHYYGETKTFTTDGNSPVVTTNSVSDIMALSATCGGNVTAEGSSSVTERGVCWSIEQNPTLDGADCYNLVTETAGVGSYIIDIIGLQPATTYYVRAYATNEFGTSYGEEVNFITDDGIIHITTDENGSDITTTMATWGGEITDDGGMEIVERGICWSSTVAEPTVDGTGCSYIASTNAGVGGFICTLTDLLPNTLYYVRAYAANAQNHYYGQIITFSTDGNPPTVTTNAVSNIMALSATCGGNVTNEGSSAVTERGVSWSTNQNPTVGGADCYNLVAETAGVGDYTIDITSLQPAITYYVKAYATNEFGISYGEEVEFTTDDGIIHIMTNDTGADITVSTAVVGGEVTDDGGMEVIERGICWSSTNSLPTVDGTGCSYIASANAGIGTFTCIMTDLLPNTSYYVRAYAVNAQGHYYGETETFTTDGNPPIVTTNSVSDIKALSATCGGNVTNEGSSAVTERGVCWSTNQNPIVGGTECQNQSSETAGVGDYTIEITELLPSTTYYVKAYAINEFGTSYGEEIEFTTDDGIIHVTTNNSGGNITASTAVWSGEVTDNGGMEVIKRGMCWSSTVAEPTVDDSGCWHIVNATVGLGRFTCLMSNLLPHTLYYIRAYAANAQGYYYGETKTFTTGGNCPMVMTDAVNNVTALSASCVGNVTNEGSSAVTERGVCWSTNQNPTLGGADCYNLVAETVGVGSYIINITGLQPATTYYVKAYAINEFDTSYGEEIEFTTDDGIIHITTDENGSDITTTAATWGGEVTDDGGMEVTSRGVCYSSTIAEPTADGSECHHVADVTAGTGAFTCSLTNLLPHTLYYVRAYAANAQGHYYGETKTFTTDGNPPVVMTNAVSHIMALSATFDGNVTNEGSSAVTERGVCWSTNQNPTVGGACCYNLVAETVGVGSYIIDISGLQPATTYYVKAYAINEFGTSYGEEVNFTTDNGIINITTDENGSNITTTAATWGGVVTDDGGMEVIERGVCYSSTNENPTVDGIDCQTKAATSGGEGEFTVTLTNLSPSTTYYVRAYAMNADGTNYGTVKTFTTPTGVPAGETFTVNGVDFKMLPVAGGTFKMGAQSTNLSGDNYDTDADDDESPVHSVTLSSFSMGETEVTQALWEAVTGYTPTNGGDQWESQYGLGDEYPAYYVSWDDIQTFLTQLNTQCSSQLGGRYFALPTEAQWEYAARGGNVSQGYKYAGSNAVGDVAWYEGNAGEGVGSSSPDYGTHPVKGKNPNELGLYDMSGNVVEWCQDGYDYYSGSASTDPQGPFLDPYSYHVFRGGCWFYDDWSCRASSRSSSSSDYRELIGGFRIVLLPPAPPTVSTNSVTNVTSTSVQCCAHVIADGGSTVTNRGVCYSSTNTEPTVGGSECQTMAATTDSTGEFIVTLTELDSLTTYYVRAYATNAVGTGYGTVKTCTTFVFTGEVFIVNGVNFKMIPVEGGTFMMGAQNDNPNGDNYDALASDDESPVHSVTLSSFSMGETEVTQALWEAVTEDNPSFFQSGTDYLQRPVEALNWNDIQVFLTQLNTLCASQLNGRHFAMPTEAQWEYAARGGNISQGYKYSGSNDINEVAWYDDNSSSTTHIVKTKNPNELGLYDMSGNVSEWCQDWYGSDYYSSSSSTDPQGPSAGTDRVMRGGSWYVYASNCRASFRTHDSSGSRFNDYGFRLVLLPGSLSEVMPTVETSAVGTVNQFSAECGGNVIAAGNSAVTTRGVCYSSTNTEPAVGGSDCQIVAATSGGEGAYTVTLMSLLPSTTYHVRAYATNADGTGYGIVKTFTTFAFIGEVFTVNGVDFKMIPVEGGTFKMGAQNTDENGDNYDEDAENDESPVHSVTLSSFSMGETEVTQALWQAVTGSNPSDFTSGMYFVENVSWNDIQTFLAQLNSQCASWLGGRHFALPTEAQWEYAARGGNASQGYKYAGSNTIRDVMWYGNNSSGMAHTVKGKLPNELGLYDMSGNVYEWCQDWYEGDYDISSASTDPQGPSAGSSRVLRGGSRDDYFWNCRVSNRYYNYPYFRGDGNGFRLVLLPDSLSEGMPTVETSAVSVVDTTSAECGGNVTDAGTSTVTSRGVCYSSTNENPTVDGIDCQTKAATSGGEGEFTVILTGLNPATTYYVRAYATNAGGTNYGTVKTFTTPTGTYAGETFTVGGVDFTMIPVEGGTFKMGAQSTNLSGDNYDTDAWDAESPVHSVTLSSFSMGETEVTQALWEAVTGKTPTDDVNKQWKSQYGLGDDYPAYRVSWDDIQTFLTQLNNQCSGQLNGRHFALPTEAQWEYAARGGNASQGYKYAGSNTIDDVAWYGDNSIGTAHAVKGKLPNELGLYDMCGNVNELCQDWYDENYYSSSSSTDPQGPSAGTQRVIRGGSWNYIARICRASFRSYIFPDDRSFSYGFRLVLLP